MNQLKFVFSASLLFFIATVSCSQNGSERASSLGVFVASTPCSQGTKPLPGIPASADCELIKWHLTLFQDNSTKTPTDFKLQCVYGLPKQGTTGFIGGGKKVDLEGKWTIVKGTTANPNAIVYRLTPGNTTETISFLKLNDDLLHLLDSQQHLMIGSAAWSYTLNRMDIK